MEQKHGQGKLTNTVINVECLLRIASIPCPLARFRAEDHICGVVKVDVVGYMFWRDKRTIFRLDAQLVGSIFAF